MYNIWMQELSIKLKLAFKKIHFSLWMTDSYLYKNKALSKTNYPAPFVAFCRSKFAQKCLD